MGDNNVDLSLEDIIKINRQNKKSAKSGARRDGAGGGPKKGGGGGKTGGKSGGGVRARGGRGRPARGGGGGGGGRRGDPLRRTSKGGVQKLPPPRPSDLRQSLPQEKKKSTKLVITNLELGVTDSDIQELFVEFGELTRANVNYDRHGTSLGSAEVVFAKGDDARKAFKQYNGVPLDGRPMDIKFAASENDIFRPPAPSTQSSGRFGGNTERRRRSALGGAPAGRRSNTASAQGRQRGVNGAAAGRTRRRRGAGNPRSGDRPKVSAADLDRQLEDYAAGGDGQSKTGGAAAATAGKPGRRRGGGRGKKEEISAADLDKQLDNYINRMETE